MTSVDTGIDGPALVVVPTPIGNLGDMTPRALAVLGAADSVACEDTRRTGSLFASFGIDHDPFIVCNDHNEAAAGEEIVRRLAGGQLVALVSDAGTPAVSDPGSRVVAAVIDAGYDVHSLPGPSAVLVGLTVSGLITDRFCFEGFLPRKGAERGARIEALLTESRTAVLFEAPHRIVRTVDDLAERLGPERRIVLARELTKTYEDVWRGSLSDARQHLRTNDPRGEFVVVLEGATPTTVTEDELTAALQREFAAGASTRDAVATVVELTNAKKRQVYDLALRLSND